MGRRNNNDGFLPRELELMKDKSMTRVLLIGKDGDVKEYLMEAFNECEDFSHKKGIRFNQMEFIRERVSEIMKMSSFPHQMLNPNDRHVQNMVINGDDLYTIWATMKKSYGNAITYIPFEDRKVLMPKLKFTGFGEEYSAYPLLKGIPNAFRLKRVTYKTYLRDTWKRPMHYEKLLGVLMDLMQYHSISTLQMIDVFSGGIVTKTVCAIYSYMVDVICTYGWCFIREKDTEGMLNLFTQYRNNVLALIEECILTFMYYDDISNIPDNINSSVLTDYADTTTSILLDVCDYTKKVTFLESTTSFMTGPVVFAENVFPVLSRSSYGFREYRYSLYGVEIGNRCIGQTHVTYKTITGLYDSLIESSINELKGGWKNERLFLINTKTGERILKNIDNVLQCPWVKLEYREDDKCFYTTTTEKSLNQFKDAPVLSEKTDIKSGSSDDRNCSAFYTTHAIQGIPKSLLHEMKITRKREFDEDFYINHESVYPTMNARELADITDRTLGFEEYDLYNKHPGGDIDRSSWEPRRNNWTLTH